MFGIGAGYKWNWFRVDITTDYAGKANFKGDYASPNAVHRPIDTWTMLANGYIDLGDLGRLLARMSAAARRLRDLPRFIGLVVGRADVTTSVTRRALDLTAIP